MILGLGPIIIRQFLEKSQNIYIVFIRFIIKKKPTKTNIQYWNIIKIVFLSWWFIVVVSSSLLQYCINIQFWTTSKISLWFWDHKVKVITWIIHKSVPFFSKQNDKETTKYFFFLSKNEMHLFELILAD